MNKRICFVMMPFGDNYEEYYEQIYHQAIEECDFLPRRADSLYRPSPILYDIWTFINDSLFVLADITGRNPNVMYELGLAHAIAKPAILITNNVEDIPFDLRSLRVIIYNIKEPGWDDNLKRKVKKSINEIVESPVDAVLPPFLKVQSSKKEEVSEIKKDLIEIKQYLYSLDFGRLIEKKPKTRVLTAKEYNEAIQETHGLYYDQGLDILEIKNYLMSKFSISNQIATDMIDIVRRQ